MATMRRAFFFALLTIAVIGHGDHGPTSNATSIPLGTPAKPQAHGPSAFVPNVGQWTHPACFVARLAGGAVFAEEARLLLSWQAQRDGDRVHGAAIGMRFEAPATGEVVPEQHLAGVHHYFLGKDPARWRSDVPRYRAVRYRGQWPGVAVLCYEKDGHFEYDVELEPNADLAQVEFTVEGSTGLRIDGDGALMIDTPAGPLRQARPATHVDLGGERRAIAAAYELRGPDRFGFVAPEWNGDGMLVVDPGLVWATVLGGSMADSVAAVATGTNGVVTTAGMTQSADYPISVGAWSTSFVAGRDAVLTRLDPSLPAAQQLLWSTFLGASSQDWATALAVDAAGIITVTGYTMSQGFPTTAGAWDSSINGFGDAFVARLDPSLPAPQQLQYSTYYGGNDDEVPQALCVDGAGRVTIAGETASNSLPMPANAWMAQAHGFGDGFVARLDPSLPGAQQLVYATYVGTNNMAREVVHGLGVDANGVITMAGWTADPAFPTTPGAWNRTSAGVFVPQPSNCATRHSSAAAACGASPSTPRASSRSRATPRRATGRRPPARGIVPTMAVGTSSSPGSIPRCLRRNSSCGRRSSGVARLIWHPDSRSMPAASSPWLAARPRRTGRRLRGRGTDLSTEPRTASCCASTRPCREHSSSSTRP